MRIGSFGSRLAPSTTKEPILFVIMLLACTDMKCCEIGPNPRIE